MFLHYTQFPVFLPFINSESLLGLCEIPILESHSSKLTTIKMTLAKEKSRKSFISAPETEKGLAENYSYIIDDFGLGHRFLNNLNMCKDKIHQVDAISGITETNGSLRQRSIKVAMAMRLKKITENDVILICSKAHSDQTVAFLAGLLIGSVVSPIDPEATANDLKFYVLSLKPKMIFCDLRISKQLEIIYRDASGLPPSSIVVFGDHTDHSAFEKLLTTKLPHDFKPTTITNTKTKIAFILPTQNTNGVSKLVCISHRAMLIQITTYAAKMLTTGADKMLSFFPLSWITQLALTCYCLEYSIMRILPGSFNERSACRLIHDLKIDTAFLGTDAAVKIMNHPSVQDFDISSLKNIYVGGILTPALDMANMRALFAGARVHQCYGMTEMSGLVAAFSESDYENALEKPGSIGSPMPNIKVKIVDINTREPLGPDWWGELLLAGPTMMLGYYKDGQKNKDVITKGFFKTGDIAQLDEDGYLYIQGRISDHIILNGGHFVPNQIEELILAHPEVLEVIVLGDTKEVVACVIKKQGSRLTVGELMRFIETTMPASKRPTKVKFMDSFPRTSAGKIKRNVIKQMALGVTIVHSKSIVSFESGHMSND